MIKLKGILNTSGEVVFQYGKPLPLSTLYHQSIQIPVVISLELSVTVGLNTLISGIDGFVWATKDNCQAEIICNALNVQKFNAEIVKGKLEKKALYLIKVNREEDIKEVIDFIQNDAGGLRLKPDWNYPEGERNQSFEQWVNE